MMKIRTGPNKEEMKKIRIGPKRGKWWRLEQGLTRGKCWRKLNEIENGTQCSAMGECKNWIRSRMTHKAWPGASVLLIKIDNGTRCSARGEQNKKKSHRQKVMGKLYLCARCQYRCWETYRNFDLTKQRRKCCDEKIILTLWLVVLFLQVDRWKWGHPLIEPLIQ